MSKWCCRWPYGKSCGSNKCPAVMYWLDVRSRIAWSPSRNAIVFVGPTRRRRYPRSVRASAFR